MAEIAVIVPAHNAGGMLEACLTGLTRACQELACEGLEARIIVVDDASTDAPSDIAARHDCTFIRQATRQGAAAARNRGAQAAKARVIAFVDADVVVAPDAIVRLLQALDTSDAAAVFGAYDTAPAAPGLTSQYRNLLHHFVHLTGAGQAQTFWSGLGAIRRDVFERVGGFDAEQHMMEDVELGMRLAQKGHAITLDPGIQGTHLKHWSLPAMIRTDVLHRAIPWSRLLRRYGGSRDLNLSARHRIGAVGALLCLLALCLWPFSGAGAVLSGAAGAVLFPGANLPFLRFLVQVRGVGFALAAIAPHFVHTCCGIAGFGWVHIVERARAVLLPAPQRLCDDRIHQKNER